MPKKILITGASGFIGQVLTQNLLAAGHQITAISRAPAALNPHPNLQIIPLDLETLTTFEHPDKHNVLITLAQSEHFRNPQDKQKEIEAVNVNANRVLWQWGIAHGIEQAIHFSSGGVAHAKNNQELSFYLHTKKQSEEILQSLNKNFTSQSIIRPYFVYGPQQKPDMLIRRLAANIRNNKEIALAQGTGPTLAPVYIEDLVAAIAGLIQNPTSGTFDASGPNAKTLKEIAKIMASILDKELKIAETNAEVIHYSSDPAPLTKASGVSFRGFEEGFKECLQKNNNF